MQGKFKQGKANTGNLNPGKARQGKANLGKGIPDVERQCDQVRWLKPVIPALWEAETGGSRGREIETILVNMVKPRLY